jgi:hypothetical protein
MLVKCGHNKGPAVLASLYFIERLLVSCTGTALGKQRRAGTTTCARLPFFTQIIGSFSEWPSHDLAHNVS